MLRKALNSDFPKLCKYYKEFDENGIDLFNKGPFSNLIIYEDNDEIKGFISYSIMYDRAEIDFIYVEEAYRRQNIAFELMNYCIEDASHSGCYNITLEVNEKNDAGIRLYEKFGFQRVAIRPKYYHGIDGILMMKELKKSE